jgi:hypothetical protein
MESGGRFKMNELRILPKLFIYWLKDCWSTRPRFQRCDTCGKRVAIYGEDAMLVCSDECAYEMIPF